MHKSHIPAGHIEAIEAGEFPWDYCVARMVQGVLKLTDKSDDDAYFYKGVQFHKDTALGHGYYGRWRIGTRGRGNGFGSLAEVKRHIDANAKTTRT